MAVTKILAKDARLDKLIRYVVNPKKTDEQVFVSSVGCVPETAARTWMDTKRRFGRTDGVQAYHLIQSFKPGEITPELAHEIGNRFAERYLDGFEVIVGTHVDKAHVHGQGQTLRHVPVHQLPLGRNAQLLHPPLHIGESSPVRLADDRQTVLPAEAVGQGPDLPVVGVRRGVVLVPVPV